MSDKKKREIVTADDVVLVNTKFMRKNCPESSPTQERSNDLIGRSELGEHEADAAGNQGESSEAETRAIGAVSEQLLMPCPFCGLSDLQVRDNGFNARVHCCECGADGPSKWKTRGVAIRTWNARI